MGAQAGLWGDVCREGAERRVGKERRWRAGSFLLSSLIPRGSAEEGMFPARVSLPALALLAFGSSRDTIYLPVSPPSPAAPGAAAGCLAQVAARSCSG